MIFRGLYHFSVAYDKGKADDPIKYFAAKENQDLGVVKRCENQSPSWIYPLFLHPLDKSAITLTSHRCKRAIRFRTFAR